ncbi:MAG: hypothetical protein H6737_13890 [Alphaproteobacteria bacterium]|nr:hypothetical protein [Alphaproteobacteria bacterium]
MRLALLALLPACYPVEGDWTPMTEEGAPEIRTAAATAWTGSEVLVWGGYTQGFVYGCLTGANDLQTGSRYDPESDAWAPMSVEGAPDPASNAGMWWTGTHALVWTQLGGSDWPFLHAYDPAADAWLVGSAPGDLLEHDPTYYPTWTGEEVVVWSPGYRSAAYRPETDTWRPIESFGPPGGDRYAMHSASTGSQVYYWSPNQTGGERLFYPYDLETDAWTELEGGPTVRLVAELPAVWTGEEFLIVTSAGEGGSWVWHYDPESATWEEGPHGPRVGGKAARMGDRIAFWADRGAIYAPDTREWSRMPRKRSPRARKTPAMQWTGDALVVWGGGSDNPCDDDAGEGGAVWRP